MPGPLRASDLARKARRRFPNIAILFASGYADNAMSHRGQLEERIDLLPKPYSRDQIALKLRSVLKKQHGFGTREGPSGAKSISAQTLPSDTIDVGPIAAIW